MKDVYKNIEEWNLGRKHILKYQKKLDQILHIFLFQKF